MKMEVEFSKVEVEALVAATIESRYPAPPDYKWESELRYTDVVTVRLEKIEEPKPATKPEPEAEPMPEKAQEPPF